MAKFGRIILTGGKRQDKNHRKPRTWSENEERKAHCDGKVKHKSYLAAEFYLNRTKIDLEIYECKFCGFHHLGHTKPKP